MNGGAADASSPPTYHQRAIAALLDGIIATALASLVPGAPLLGGLVMGVYLVGRDGLTVGRLQYGSLGKYVMGLRLVPLGDRPLTMITSVHRNWMLGVFAFSGLLSLVPIVGSPLAALLSSVGLVLILYEIYTLFVDAEGRRWGDRAGRTRVVAHGDGLL
jgi:hypothetical protein